MTLLRDDEIYVIEGDISISCRNRELLVVNISSPNWTPSYSDRWTIFPAGGSTMSIFAGATLRSETRRDKLISTQRYKAIELMASFNDRLHLAFRARSFAMRPSSFVLFPTARFRATTRMILSPFPPSLLPASWACELAAIVPRAPS